MFREHRQRFGKDQTAAGVERILELLEQGQDDRAPLVGRESERVPEREIVSFR